ncbi:COG0637 Predicted phosphatase/phosphohexomutase [Paracoccaceae bacterium]
MLKALIFDVDGTICETEEIHRAAFNRAFAETGLNLFWTVEDYRRLLRTTGGKERMRRHRQDRGLAQPDDEAIVRLHLLKTQYYVAALARGGIAPRPGVRELVSAARQNGLALAIATTTSPANVEGLVQAIWGQPAHQVFDVIAAGDEVAAKKPAPDVYLLALHRLGLPPDAANALEDSRNGLDSARAAGLRVVVTPSTYTATEDFSGADAVVASLADWKQTFDW